MMRTPQWVMCCGAPILCRTRGMMKLLLTKVPLRFPTHAASSALRLAALFASPSCMSIWRREVESIGGQPMGLYCGSGLFMFVLLINFPTSHHGSPSDIQHHSTASWHFLLHEKTHHFGSWCCWNSTSAPELGPYVALCSTQLPMNLI